MEDKLKNFLSSCSEMHFGVVKLSEKENEFCHELNGEVVSLCKALPESTKIEALLFFMRYFRIPDGKTFSFFMKYYVPAWSIIFWLSQFDFEGKRLKQEDMKNAKSAHSMALILHILDDHLNDNDLPATHLTLLLRSQSWMIMNNAVSRLAEEVDGGEEIPQNFIDDYYSSILNVKEVPSLDSYCDFFRKQMRMWLMVPILMIKKMSYDKEFADGIQSAYESFGIAWRLLDDINDIQADMIKGVHSAIYISLPEKIRNYWDDHKGVDCEEENGYSNVILNYILESRIVQRIKQRICGELNLAASIADKCAMPMWGDEFRCLMSPMINDRDHLWTRI